MITSLFGTLHGLVRLYKYVMVATSKREWVFGSIRKESLGRAIDLFAH